MKQVLVITVLCALFFQSFSKDLIITNFFLNQEYITHHYCVNKDNPEMECNGKCHLAKTLKKDSQQKKDGAPLLKIKIVLFFQELREVVLYTNYSHSDSFAYQGQPGIELPVSIFHPPKFLS